MVRFGRLTGCVVALVIGWLFWSKTVIQAQVGQPPPIHIQPRIGFGSLDQAINTIFSLVMFLGALLTFGYLVFGAMKYLTAKDDASQVTAARQTMQNAIIGLFLLGLIFVIFGLVTDIVPGLDDLFITPGE